MKRLRPRRTFGLALAIVSMLPVGAAPSGFDRLNLDLPYNAAGGDSEEDDWIDTVHFYGVSVEANAVVFCLDESESMFGPRWEAQKREITRSIRDLDSRTRFNVTSTHTRMPSPRSASSLAMGCSTRRPRISTSRH